MNNLILNICFSYVPLLLYILRKYLLINILTHNNTFCIGK